MVNKRFASGFDIGGTKCAVILAELPRPDEFRIVGKKQFRTADFPRPEDCLAELSLGLGSLLNEYGVRKDEVRGVGISCGGPLDSAAGVVQSPPNLPGWNNAPVTGITESLTGLKAKLENDANACALAEWRFGAGRGTSDMVFLTFGTGLGAGIIANGHLLCGRSGMAGECGHIRLAAAGPVGYRKEGSFEGFCSGGGIAQLGRRRALEAIKAGHPPVWCRTPEELDSISAKQLAEAALSGDSDALAVYMESGRRLGEGLAILIDILNPECIVIGSIFTRAEKLLRPEMERAIGREALQQSASVCRIVPAELGESIGDVAALAVIAS